MTEPTKPKTEPTKPKLYAANCSMLDPTDCGSLIAYKIVGQTYNYLEAEITLTDCSRSIGWNFGGENAVEKINVAIRMFTQFKKELIKAQKAYKKDFPSEKKD